MSDVVSLAGAVERPPEAAPTNAMTFALTERPKAKRRHAPKSRAGCVTCKKRRVRCDEAKPTCLNCAKSNRACEGYHPLRKPTVTAAESQLREYRPILIKPNYETQVFTSQLERDQFEYWMTFSKEFTLFPSDLVTQLIPQIAREEPAIRHAAFAIGAATLGSDSRGQRTSGAGPYTKDAFQHYGRAIHLIRSSEPGPRSMPRALLSCLLFVTFEAIQGNYRAALTHINHGCSMLDQLLRQGVSGGCPPKLVDEVISGFQRFTLQSWTVDGYHPPETETWVPWCCRGKRSRYAVDEMPAVFGDLSEAHRWWEAVQHHIVYRTQMYSSLRFGDLSAPAPGLRQLSRNQIEKYCGILTRWRSSFQHLDAIASETPDEDAEEATAQDRSRDKRARLQRLSLKLLHLSFEIYVKTSQHTNKEVLSKMTPSFKKVVSMSRAVLEGQSPSDKSKEVFTMDTSPSWSLLSASTFCTDSAVREEAHFLLRDYPRRDGVWDTRLFTAISKASQDPKTQDRWACGDHFDAVLLNEETVMYRDEAWRREYALADGRWRIINEQKLPAASE
ncbi:Transcriptional regulatory protein moc3 [Colletotrichum tanaceti]|uniref:Transcriptional regulatory protein moc3 n=1 Tax=Colletotrichum tanaceti TaxID=1306861 RepID=A0A4U6XKU3_9PEZI|nr:Transcriptional regulatory protein moc3 [Colletotrichum tanaceti]TKW56223.1 Transcriptional regulatory protein moc3 [Colletotrichum tanaceti]